MRLDHFRFWMNKRGPVMPENRTQAEQHRHVKQDAIFEQDIGPCQRCNVSAASPHDSIARRVPVVTAD